MKPLRLSGVVFLLHMCFALSLAQSSAVIFVRAGAPSIERLAAREVRRYLYARTGEIVPIVQKAAAIAGYRQVVLVGKEALAFAGKDAPASLASEIGLLGGEQYRIRSFTARGRQYLLFAGGDSLGTLYAAYRFAQELGVWFALEGDVVPDRRLPLSLPSLDILGKPRFGIRGIQPFHDFPEGPDWWGTNEYKSVIAQLPKLGMNFIGLHTYPESAPNAEPTVWIGMPGDYTQDGTVTFSYPSSYMNTGRGNWGYQATKTSDYHYGASLLFDQDCYGVGPMKSCCPEPRTPTESNLLFNQSAHMLRDAFTFAHTLGVQTCVGTEIPLTIPKLVRERYKGRNADTSASAMAREIYKGIFSRIGRSYPIDYYWFWTWEGWTWSDATPEQAEAVKVDLAAALQAAADAGAPFKLATCGWVLGPPSDRAMFDRLLPKNVAVSCINREVGKAPVDVAFAKISGRSKWVIPWLEDDPSLTSPQLWVGRMRRDAEDALRYGCDGLLGIHWRTRILSPNVSALARSAWEDTSRSNNPGVGNELEGPINGRHIARPDSVIKNTTTPAIYQDVRDRVFGYRLKVPNGVYRVTLQFCDFEIDGARGLFDVLLQGKKVVEKLDVVARVGRSAALDLTFDSVQVNDGRLLIDFADRIQYPAIAGIVVSGKNFIRKINCGGPAAADYEADWPETPRFLPSRGFYDAWARAQFGAEVATDAAAVFARIDGHLPTPSNWVDGPGGLIPDPRPWKEVKQSYGFVDELAALRSRVVGSGNIERFEYWLTSFEYMRSIGQLNCQTAVYARLRDSLRSIAHADTEALAREILLPKRVEVVATVRDILTKLLSIVSNSGEMGTVANWEQHNLPGVLDKPGAELEKMMGASLPPRARLTHGYEGAPRLIVPCMRTNLENDEQFSLRACVLSKEQPSSVVLHWRPLGKGKYRVVPFRHISRGVYELDMKNPGEDFEYYVEAGVEGKDLVCPVTAPGLAGSVVVMK